MSSLYEERWGMWYKDLMGSLAVNILVPNGTWQTIWFRSGSQGYGWNEAVIDLSEYQSTPFKIRLVAQVSQNTWAIQSDIAIDALTIGKIDETPPNVIREEDFSWSCNNQAPEQINFTNLVGNYETWHLWSPWYNHMVSAMKGESLLQIDESAESSLGNYNYSFDVDIRFHNISAHRAGIFFNYQNSNNYYYIYLEEGKGASSNDALVFAKKDNGTVSILAQASIQELVQTSKWYGFRLQYENGSFRFYLDKGDQEMISPIFEVTDTTYQGGSLGLRNYKNYNSGGTSWDNILVTNDGPAIFSLSSKSAFNQNEVDGITLFKNVPNPFSDHTQIRYTLERSGKVHLEILDHNTAQTIIVLVDQMQKAGNHNVYWDSKDLYGNKVRSGIYYARLEVNGKHQIIRLLVE